MFGIIISVIVLITMGYLILKKLQTSGGAGCRRYLPDDVRCLVRGSVVCSIPPKAAAT